MNINQPNQLSSETVENKAKNSLNSFTAKTFTNSANSSSYSIDFFTSFCNPPVEET